MRMAFIRSKRRPVPFCRRPFPSSELVVDLRLRRARQLLLEGQPIPD